jgi:SAM-dependent methyltransferase
LADSVELREREFHDRIFADGTRAKVAPIYALAIGSRRRYEASLLRECRGLRVLEYGCGRGSKAFALAEHGAAVVGIDISKEAIRQSTERARALGLDEIEFREMNAQRLDWGADSFDRVCGSGILHHLDLKAAYGEIARVLRPDGNAVFFEPLGHNPLINWYRRRTPELRTPDEHPLLAEDLDLAHRYFRDLRVAYFHLTSFAALPLRKLPGFRLAVASFDLLDRGLFRLLPLLRKQAWIAVIELAQPRHRF